MIARGGKKLKLKDKMEIKEEKEINLKDTNYEKWCDRRMSRKRPN